MRSAERISRRPGEWKDHQAAERLQILRQLLRELRTAEALAEPWYEWVRARAERRHVHGLTGPDGSAIACPFPGCTDAGAKAPARLVEQRSAVTPPAELDEQMSLSA